MRVIFVPPGNNQELATARTRTLAGECGAHTLFTWQQATESFTPSVHRFLVANHDAHRDLAPLYASAIARRLFAPFNSESSAAISTTGTLLVLGFPKYFIDLETLFRCVPDYVPHDLDIAIARWPDVAMSADCELTEFFAKFNASTTFASLEWLQWKHFYARWQQYSNYKPYINPLLSFTPGMRRCDAVEEAAVVQWTLEWTESRRSDRHFCGTHPVLLANESIEQMLCKRDYAVSEKIDGERFFLAINEQSKVYFIDRSTRVHVRHLPECVAHGQWDGSLFDCEMLRIGPYESNVEIIILDVLAYQRRSCCNLPLYDRLAFAGSFVSAIAKCAVDRQSGQRLWWHMRMQTYVHLERGAEVRKCFLSAVDQRDGFVFTPERSHYRLGTDSHLLKFQVRSRISVDFCFRRPNLLYVGGEGGEVLFKGSECNSVPSGVTDGSIIECVVDEEKLNGSPGRVLQWRFLRVRKDKQSPNIWWAANNNVKTIRQNISFDRLLQMLGERSVETVQILPLSTNEVKKQEEHVLTLKRKESSVNLTLKEDSGGKRKKAKETVSSKKTAAANSKLPKTNIMAFVNTDD